MLYEKINLVRIKASRALIWYRVLCIMLINDIKTAFDMTAVSARDATNKDKIMSLN